MQLQLSLTIADDLYDLLLLSGEPVDYLDAAQRLLALRGSPEALCREIMNTMVVGDRRFCWHSPTTIGLLDWKLADPDLADVVFVVVDLETTGTRPGDGKITEIGAVRIERLQVVGEFETLVNPQRPIPAKVVEITGITPQMLVGQPRIEHVLPHFLDFARDAVIVAHNALFDVGFLNYELARLRGRRLGEGAIDTVLLARLLAPGLPNHRLGTVARALGAPDEACHRALPDARATAHVFLTLLGRLQERGITGLNEARSIIDPSHKRDKHKIALTRDLPRRPGTYLFRDSEGEVLYVGKADQLRDRVRSYFLASSEHPRKVRQAVRRLQKVDWEETGSPLEAVVREQELILEHRPSCNVFGRRPEHYAYVKVAGNGKGLRLYATERAADLQQRGVPLTASKGRRFSTVVGPFRGRTRVHASLELLARCYPIRQCHGVPKSDGCLYGQTDRCLAPCGGDPDSRRDHDDLVLALLGWVAGDRLPDEDDPVARARQLMTRLAEQRRFEEAEKVRRTLGDLIALRRAYRALIEACRLDFAAVFPPTGDGFDRSVRLNLVWKGRLVEAISLTSGTATAEVGRILRGLPRPAAESGAAPVGRGRSHVAVPQDQLDLLLVVRRWYLDNPSALTLAVPAAESPEERLEQWRRLIVAEALRLLD
jgi:DNA polymerase-3 subunit epsilon